MTTIEILNLKCGGCVNTVKNGLLQIDGVSNVSVDLDTSKVTIDTNDAKILAEVKHKLSKLGYPEIGESNTLVHKAKSLVSCTSGKLTQRRE